MCTHIPLPEHIFRFKKVWYFSTVFVQGVGLVQKTYRRLFSSAIHINADCIQLENSGYLTFSAGPFSLALSLALFPSSPSWTNSSSKFISSSSTRCSPWMLAAMLARALMTAKEQCLRRKNSYEQVILQSFIFSVLYNADIVTLVIRLLTFFHSFFFWRGLFFVLMNSGTSTDN